MKSCGYNDLLQIVAVEKGLEMPKSRVEMEVMMAFFAERLFLRNLALEAMSGIQEIKLEDLSRMDSRDGIVKVPLDKCDIIGKDIQNDSNELVTHPAIPITVFTGFLVPV